MESNVDLKVTVSSKEATRKIEKATLAAEKLKDALDDLRDIQIGIQVVSIKRPWWKFWA